MQSVTLYHWSYVNVQNVLCRVLKRFIWTPKTHEPLTCDFQQCGLLCKPRWTCAARNSKWCLVSSLTINSKFHRLAKALIRLHVCAGWSETLPFALCWKSVSDLTCWLMGRENIWPMYLQSRSFVMNAGQYSYPILFVSLSYYTEKWPRPRPL